MIFSKYFKIPKAEIATDKVFYSLAEYTRSTKRMYSAEINENLLLFYPRYFETEFGLNCFQILNWYYNDISLDFGDIIRVNLNNISPSEAMEYVNDDTIVKHWVSNEFYVRLSDRDYWNIVQAATGEILLFIDLNSPVEDVIVFTRQSLISSYICQHY